MIGKAFYVRLSQTTAGGKGNPMKTPVFTGCATALVTPYDEIGVDYALLERSLERQISCGTAALVICATTGEAPVLSDAERAELVGFCARHINGRARLIAGIGGNDTQKAAAAARQAEVLGADGVMLTAPYYNRANSEGLYRHFTYVAAHTGLPLIVYNVPGRTGVKCPVELYARLSDIHSINGIKEASGDISLVSDTIRLCGDEMNIWSGNDDQTLPVMALGARGVISVASNLIPREMAQLCEYMLLGDLDGARSIHKRYSTLFDLLFIENNPIPVKTALTLMGMDHGIFRLPLCSMEDRHMAALENCLRDLALIM